MEQTKGKRLISLFFSMLYISAFTFGGGFVIVTLMKRRFVDELTWLDEQEMLDMTALAQSSPGAIAVNAAVLVGWKTGGFAGMLTAALGTVLPPVAILRFCRISRYCRSIPIIILAPVLGVVGMCSSEWISGTGSPVRFQWHIILSSRKNNKQLRSKSLWIITGKRLHIYR